MTIASLCLSGLARVKKSGSPPATVAAEVIAREWSQADDATRRELATVGLATLINQAMAAERYRDISEQIDREVEQCQKETRDVPGNIPPDGDGVPSEEVERIHHEMHCPNRTCDKVYHRRACVKKWILDRASGHSVGTPEWAAVVESSVADMRKMNDRQIREERESLSAIVNISAEFGHRSAMKNLRSIMLVAADGSMKPLIDFSLDDVRSWKKNSSAKAVSWAKRARFFKRIESAMVAAQVDHVCDLSPDTIEELAQAAESIWKKARERKNPAQAAS